MEDNNNKRVLDHDDSEIQVIRSNKKPKNVSNYSI